MSKWFTVIALAFTMVLATQAMAKDKGAKPLHGKVTAIAKDATDATLTDITVSHGKKGETPTDTVIKVNDKTPITKDGQTLTLADVTVGASVNVTMDENSNPTAIEIRVHKKKAQ